MLTKPVTVVETLPFSRQASSIWDGGELAEFVDFIARNPEAGAVIPETGGVRKVRWSRPGSGKRGGVRVIYFYHRAEAPLFLLMIYAKARREDMSPDDKRAVRRFALEMKRHLQR
jgi:hypothetical protein